MTTYSAQGLFISAISGLNSTYAALAKGKEGGLSLEDLTTNLASSSMLNGTNYKFISYLTNNFGTLDKDGDGKITAQDITDLSNKISKQGMTYEEIVQLCNSGYSSALMNTVLTYFDEIDKNKDGKTTVDELVSGSVFGQDPVLRDRAVSIFQTYAKKDGDYVLSEERYAEALNSEEYREFIYKVNPRIEEMVEENKKRNEEIQKGFEEATNLHNSEVQKEVGVEDTGTPRDHIAAAYGESFANEVYDPMKKMANEALEFMENNSGSLEGFAFTGMPFGVKIIQITPCVNYDDNSNDVMTISNGKPQVLRHVDNVRALVLFEFNGKKYTIDSEQASQDIENFGNIASPYVEESKG